MKFTTGWIKDFYNYESPNLENTLVDLGFEVDDQILENSWNNFFIAKIIQLQTHPNADKLKICTVEYYDNETFQKLDIVCGASNVYEGMYSILALEGAIIPKTNTMLQKTKIRDFESQGMLCSSTELNIGKESEGILDLDNVTLNDSVKSVLSDGDYISIEVTANRKDALNIYGIGREIAAKCGDKTDMSKLYDETDFVKSTQCYNKKISVISCKISNLNNHNNITPLFMQNRLHQVGIPISKLCIENIINYASHCFGYKFYLSANHINIDNIEKMFESNSNQADNLGIENIFDPLHDSQQHQEAYLSLIVLHEFHKQLQYSYGDTSQAIFAFNYLIDMLSIHCKISSQDKKSNMISHINPKLNLELEKVRKISGHTYSNQEIIVALTKLNFICEYAINNTTKNNININLENIEANKLDSGFINVEIPIWRKNDIQDEYCLIEEVIRFYGVNHIEAAPLNAVKNTIDIPTDIEIKKFWSNNGFVEVFHNSFMNSKDGDKFDNVTKVDNPMNSNQSYLRNSLMHNLVNLAQKYNKYGWQCNTVFELGKVFYDGKQHQHLACLWMPVLLNWNEKSPTFFDCKCEVESFLKFQNIIYTSQKNLFNGCIWLHEGVEICRLIHANKNPELKLKTSGDVFIFEMNLDHTNNSQLHQTNRMSSNDLLKQNYYIDTKYYKVNHKDFSFKLPENLEIYEFISKLQTLFKDVDQDAKISVFDLHGSHKLKDSKQIGIRLIWDELQSTQTNEEIVSQSSSLIEIAKSLGCHYE